MRIYLAGRFDRLDELNHYADELCQLGHIVDCRWLQGLHQLHPKPELVDAPNFDTPMEAMPFAKDDLEDVANSDLLILFSEHPDSHSKRGGRHVEFGIALALGKQIIVVGPRENIFHCLPQIRRFFTWNQCLIHIANHPSVKE